MSDKIYSFMNAKHKELADQIKDVWFWDRFFKAMQEYSDQQNAELKSEVERLNKELEFMKLDRNYWRNMKAVYGKPTVTDLSKDAPLKKLKNP